MLSKKDASAAAGTADKADNEHHPCSGKRRDPGNEMLRGFRSSPLSQPVVDASFNCSIFEAVSSITTPVRLAPPHVQEVRIHSSPTKPVEKAPKTNLYIKNLPPGLKEEDLRSIFEPYGAIWSVKVMLHIHTAECS